MGDSDERSPLLINNNNTNIKPKMSTNCLFSLVFIFTYWPSQTIIKMFSSQAESIQFCVSKRAKLCRWIYGFSFIFFINFGVLAQLVTCFSRQNPYAHWVEDPHDFNPGDNNNSDIPYCKLKCDIDKNFVTGYIFPDAIIVLLSLWVYLLEPIYNLKYRCNIASLDKLIEKSTEVENNYSRFCVHTYIYTGISILYILVSLALSIGYLFAFGFVRKDVVIKSEIFSSNGVVKIISIIFSLFGFIAFDLLYIQVILRYVYRCDFLVEYLKTIKDDFPKNQANDDATIGFTDDQRKKIKTASKFLRELNKNTFAIGMVIVIAGFTAFSCIVNLISTTDCPRVNKDWQVLLVALRLILWLCIVLFPFYKAAKVNETSCELSVNLVTRSRDPKMVSKGVKYITLKARLIGILIQPWLPNAFLLIIIFAIMLGSGIKYFHVL